MPKKSNQKKGARITHDFPVPWLPKWTAPKCPRQSGGRSGSSNGSDTTHHPTERYTARWLHPRYARPTGTHPLSSVVGRSIPDHSTQCHGPYAHAVRHPH
ncbi:hypothetical protein BFF94_038155 [Burkholderia catarinensis]|nr:hypothetical protein BFF94_038155 [Burkholderia catarinensis]